MKIIIIILLFVLSTPILGADFTINLTDIKTRDLLLILAEKSKKNILISDKISGKISIKLQHTSWREALNLVMQNQKLYKHETETTIAIYPLTSIQPTTINLNYMSADEMARIIQPSGILSSTGKIGADNRTNTLIISDTNEKIKNLQDIVQQVDIPAKQVLIEAKIVCADEKFVQELGLEFNTKTKKNGPFNFSIAKLGNNTTLELEIAALESEGRGKVIASPKLLTTNRQPAYIESGSEIPYQEKTKEGDTSTAFKKAVLSLKVTPEINADNNINLILQLNQDKVSQLTVNGVPAIDTRKIQTQVLVPNGETVVLGGIYEWSKSNSINTIPIISKIPILGRLLSKTEIKIERKELLMFITPSLS